MEKIKKPLHKRWYVWVLGVVVLALVISPFLPDNEEPIETLGGIEYSIDEEFQDSASGNFPDDEEYQGLGNSSPFGEVIVFNQVNVLDEIIGTRGWVSTNKDLLTDEALIEFFHTYIYESGHNFFTLDFGDGTGYVFPSSRNRFSHQELSDDGAGINPVGVSGFVFDDYITYMEFTE